MKTKSPPPVSEAILAERVGNLRAFASGVVHELNTPLAVLASNLEFIAGRIDEAPRSGTTSETVREPLADARAAVERIRRIVRDFRAFTAADSMSTTAVDLRRVIESALRIAWTEIGGHARLVKDYCATPQVDANELRLAEALLSLFLIAARSLPDRDAETRQLRVRTDEARAGAVVEIRFRDELNVFLAGESSRMHEGIATAAMLLAGGGGNLSILHDAGEVVFRVELPLTRPSSVEMRKSEGPAAEKLPRGRILVVDDDPAIGRSVRRLLGSLHVVTAVTSAGEAVEMIARGERFDLVLCDLMMPGRSGMDLYADVQKLAPKLVDRIVFITGGSFTPKAHAFLNQISNERYTKPIDVNDLRALARRHVG